MLQVSRPIGNTFQGGQTGIATATTGSCTAATCMTVVE